MVKISNRAAIILTSLVFAGCTDDSSESGPDGGADSGLVIGSGGAAAVGAGGGAEVGAGAADGAGAGVGAGAGAGVGAGSGAGVVPDGVVGRFGLAARLSKREYKNSIMDVLGVSLLPEELDDSAGGIPDDTGDGVFKHLADNQISIEQHALAYFQVAEAVAGRADVPGLIAAAGSCTDATAECGTAIIQALGRKLYRRPLDQRETDAMLTVYNAAVGEALDHTEATRWALMAMLSAPQFLFRMQNEVAGTAETPRDLDGYELAARLAAFLWVSVPDEDLLVAASDGSLLLPDGLDAQVERMLADPKARRFTEVFAVDFSRARFSSYEGSTDEDRVALNESVVATFQDHLWDQEGSVADLFTTTRFVVNPTVAALLEIEISGDGLEAVDVADLPERVGIFSHPSMIAGMGDRVIGSFVNRGKYLLERLLCRNPAAFPASAAAEIEQFNADTTGLNEHERAEMRMGRPACWSCHQQFEPLSFGFARFDGAGRYVGEIDVDGKPLPLDGWVPTGEQEEPAYVDMASYMQILAINPVIQTCMTEHFLDFATSRNGDEVGKLEAEHVGQEYLSKGSTLGAMVSSVVHSPLFLTVVTSPQGSQP